jgi:hypothetical protein
MIGPNTIVRNDETTDYGLVIWIQDKLDAKSQPKKKVQPDLQLSPQIGFRY